MPHSVVSRSVALVCAAVVLTLPTTASSAPAGLVSGRVTIIGDSVTIDARPELVAAIRGAVIHARESEQWDQGVTYARKLKANGRLGTVVVIALGTNGPITAKGAAQMARVLSPCTRVVFVTNHVPLRWQNPNNRLLKTAATRHANIVIADWHAVARNHPGWLYPDGVHMPPGGAGARAFARLVASKV